MHHRLGLRVNCSAGDGALTVMMKGGEGERAPFYLRTSLKRDSAGLAWKTPAPAGDWGEGGVDCVCVYLHGNVCVRWICSHALVAELFILQCPPPQYAGQR